MCLEGVSVDIGTVVILGEDRLQHLDALGTGGVATVIAVPMVVLVPVLVPMVMVVVVAVDGAVIVAVESTHTRNSS